MPSSRRRLSEKQSDENVFCIIIGGIGGEVSLKESVVPAFSDDPLNLNNQLCFSFYVCSKEIIRRYRPFLEPLGLTYTAYIALLALWEEDEVTVKSLGERLYLDSGTLTPLLKKMASEGFLTRERGRDERTVTIRLTEKGKALKKKAVTIPEKMACSLGLDVIKAGALLHLLHEMMGNLRSPSACEVFSEKGEEP